MDRFIKFQRIIIVAVISIVLLVALGMILVFDPIDDQVQRYPTGGLADFEYTGYYKINPATILKSLDQGDKNVFLPELATPQTPLLNESPLVHQADYLRIGAALYQFVWKETLDSWNLYYMQFHADCTENPISFTGADLIYFKTITINGRTQYSIREILIEPRYGYVAWGTGTNFPHPLLGWKSVDLTKLKISAEIALALADQSGGKEFRLRAGNKDCITQVNLNPNVDRAEWLVAYSSDYGADSFEIYIDPYTGKGSK